MNNLLWILTEEDIYGHTHIQRVCKDRESCEKFMNRFEQSRGNPLPLEFSSNKHSHIYEYHCWKSKGDEWVFSKAKYVISAHPISKYIEH